MKPYHAYKDSGVAWLADVPKHWEIDRLRWSVTMCKNGIWGSEPEGEEGIICVRVADFDREHSLVNLEDPTYRLLKPSEKIDRILQSGDLLLEKSGGGEKQPVGFVVLYNHDEEAVCSNFIARMPIAPQQESRYWNYLNRCYYFVRVNVRSIKQTTGIQNLDSYSYLCEQVPYPPLVEQVAIAAYLDRKTAQIDAVIAKKQRLIELLREERTALISQAVTKGLPPSPDRRGAEGEVKMKDSGVAWLGEVPEHWEMKKIKYVADLKSGEGITANLISEKGDYPVYGGNGLRGYCSSYSHEGNFVLIGRQGALCGNINYAKGKFWASEHAVVATLYPGIELLWFGELLRSMNLNQFSQSAAQPGLAVEYIENLEIPIPSLPEQTAIAAYLDQKITEIDQPIAQNETQIELLREYRTTLISAVVTGKVDVRPEAEL